MRRGPKPAKSKEAKPSVGRKSPRDDARVSALEKRLAEALEQQTATSEILRVISSSPTDIQPVLDALAESAARLCESFDSAIFRRDGERLLLVAHHGPIPVASSLPLVRGSVNGRAVLDGQPVHIADLQAKADEFPEGSALTRGEGVHAHLSVPLMREGVAIGTINLRRTEAQLFTDRQVALLQTFADQAVIAIENVRLFTELQDKNEALTQAHAQVTEALDQQTATSEILRVISQSPTDVQPVFEAIAASAVRLCGAVNGAVFRFDGELIHIAAYHNISGVQLGPWQRQYPATLESRVVTARAILSRATVQVEDLTNDPWLAHTPVAQAGYRTVLSVPMMRDGLPIGAVNVVRMEVQPFSQNQVALLQTFADQAVIAIENVRLFNETKEALDQQTATAEILRVISSSPTNIQPVLDAVAESAKRLCEGYDAWIGLREGEHLRVRAHHGPIPIALDLRPLNRGRVSERAVVDRQPVHVHDLAASGEEFPLGHADAVRIGHRTTLGVPLLREGEAIGVILTRRLEVRPFTDRQIALLQTFADQAVIAIENVRLFKELEARNGELTRAHAQVSEALEQQTATADILRVISSSPTDVQPVFDAIVDSAGRLCGAESATVYRFEGEMAHFVAGYHLTPEILDAYTQAHAQVTEALEQQTATSEILRVISRSTTDVQPVLDAIARRSVELCDAYFANVFLVEGEMVHWRASHNVPPEANATMQHTYPLPTSADETVPMIVRERRMMVLEDAQRVDQPRQIVERSRTIGLRSWVGVPLLREGSAIGVLAVARREVKPFSEKQISLLQTFADQAVIAIENVRLFKELETRTHDLTRSVDELTALGDVGRVLNSTLDLETVLQTIVTRANQLTGTAGCTIWEYDEAREEFRLRVSHYADATDAAVLQALGRVTTIRKGQGVTTQVVERRQPVQIRDIAAEGAYESPIRKPLIAAGHRALLGVPLLSEDEVIGVLAVTRKTPGEFEPEIVRLLSTFATQSALAIQNARLFLEIEDKSRQLEAASQHKSEFLANMSHELRTPLNAIIGFSEVLTERMFGDLNEKQDEYLKDIHASGQHLLSLINDILDLSKIEAGRMELELTDFHLPQAIDNALTLVRERAGRRGIALHQSVEAHLGEIKGDERKVKQVLLNLLSNALKFTPEGGRVEVLARVVGGMAEISVTDTGVGIAAEDQEAVFEEFRQVGMAEKKAEGTGLGLTLCRKFIELHGGKIWVTSQVGVGSTFTFTIPVRRSE